MTLAPKITLSLTGLALLAGGAMLWLHHGAGVYFDTIASAFAGCFL